MDNTNWVVPSYEKYEFREKKKKYCLCIPIINEGERFLNQLKKVGNYADLVDVVICDGGSTDNSTDKKVLSDLQVRTLLVKTGSGKLSAQLRMGYAYALEQGYEGIITVDGNGKDGPEAIPLFIEQLENGYDMIQGSRYIEGGNAVNTPKIRHIAVKALHIPLINLSGGFKYTDTTNGYRGYSSKYLLDERVKPFREVFDTYELLAYLSVRAPQLGLKTMEVPVSRIYPAKGKVPTKISFVKGNWTLFKILFETLFHQYDPR